VFAQLVFVDDAEQVLLDFPRRRITAIPVMVLLERQRVDVRLDVASRARIGVVPPGSADFIGALKEWIPALIS